MTAQLQVDGFFHPQYLSYQLFFGRVTCQTMSAGPPFSAGHVAVFLFIGHVALLCICLPGLSLGVSGVTVAFYFSIGHVAFLAICLPGPSLLTSAFFRWRCTFVSQVCHWWCPSFSAGHVAFLVHLSPRSAINWVRPFPLAM